MVMQTIQDWQGASGGHQDNYPMLLSKCKNNFEEIMRGGQITERVRYFDDFNSDAVDAGWTVSEGTDSATSVHALDADDPNGVLRFTTGDAGTGLAADMIQLTRDLHWRAADGGLVIEARFALSAITTCYCYFGFTDLVTLEAPIESAGAADTITTTASDAVGVFFDTRMATDTWWMAGVKANADAVHQNSGFAPVAATYEIWRIEVDNAGTASFYRNNTLVGTPIANAVTITVPLTPTFAVSKTSVAASMTADLDYINISKERV